MNYHFSEALSGMDGTATRDIFKLLSRPEIISFAGGLPASDALPTRLMGEIAAEIFVDETEALRCLQYSVTEGYPGFRETVIDLVRDLGITGITPDNVLVISGGGQGLDLMLKAFVNKGDVVLMEDPTFLSFIQAAKSYNAVAVGVAADSDGVSLGDLEAKLKRYAPKLMYLIPTFSNPTGKTYPIEKRKAVIDLAHRYGVIILEDDPYSRLRFAGEPVPPMITLDKHGIVVYVSSFSKTIAPGLRTGFAVGPAEIIRKLTIGKQNVDLHTSSLSQLAIKKYIEKGYFLPNIAKSIPLYRQRKTAMTDAINRYMPASFKHTDPDGGLFIWGEFDAPVNTTDMFQAAIAENVAYIVGSVFFADGGGANTLRLNYTNESPERIEEGVQRLGRVFKGV
ncbi:MAG: PLP-dependent aminotransferase family protein [Peptococcaceae bacterium]|jgi:2-aminoadipate transaminase|nr:PLP-dependent aminotransferase family protein [Peptococcaceae bacterium]